MLELYIIRHGLAGKSLEGDVEDNERPLKKKGKEKMKDVAKGLKKRNIRFDMVLTSPLLRALESAEIVNEYCGSTKEVTVTDLLKPDASYQKLSKYLNKLKEPERVAIVGHEPFLSGFASYCLTNSKNSFFKLEKSGVLKLEIDEVIMPQRCVLSWLMEPSQMVK
jgi:phosphohistidine phosphatase